MNKERYIYGFGAGFLMLVIIKYLFVPAVFSTVYYTFEILSLLVILGLIYFVRRYFMLKSFCNNQQLEKELDKVKKENASLHVRIDEIQKAENEKNTFLTIKEKMLEDLHHTLQIDGNGLPLAIFGLIKTHFEIVSGIIYMRCKEGECFEVVQTYGLDDEWQVEKLVIGEGLHGQVILEKRAKEIMDIPEDYLSALSGTGSAQPAYIYFLPFMKEDGKSLLIELASFKKLGLDTIWNEFLDGLNEEQN